MFITDNDDPNEFIHNIIDGASSTTTHSALDRFKSMDCNLIKIVMVANMSTRLRKDTDDTNYNPKNSLVRREQDIFKAIENGNDKRIYKCNTAMMLLHNVQYNNLPENGLASEAILNGIFMIMDKKGASDRILNSFEKKGITSSAHRARDIINHIATNIISREVRKLNLTGYKPINLYAGDNADLQSKFMQLSVIPVGDIVVGYELDQDDEYFRNNYIKYLPVPKNSKTYIDCILATKEEDEVAKQTIQNQNIYALQTAFFDYNKLYMKGKGIYNGEMSRFKVGDNVKFYHHHSDRFGTIHSVTDGVASIRYLALNGDKEVANIELCDLEEVCEDTSSVTNIEVENSDTNVNRIDPFNL